MTDDTLQQLAEKYGFVLIAVERAKNMARDAYLAGEKAGLEQLADKLYRRSCGSYVSDFTGEAARQECQHIVGMIRKQVESEE